MPLSAADVKTQLRDLGPDETIKAVIRDYKKRMIGPIRGWLKKKGCEDPDDHLGEVLDDLWMDVKADFDKIWSGLKEADYTNFGAWLMTVGCRCAGRHSRKDRSRRCEIKTDFSESFDETRPRIVVAVENNIEERIFEKEVIRHLKKFALGFSQRDREILGEYVDERGYERIARRHSMTPATVRQVICRLKRSLKEEADKFKNGGVK